MIYKEISSLPYMEERAVIINVGTRVVTTLSVLSALKYANLSLLVIDCPLTTNSDDFKYFKKLMNSYEFDLLSMPLREHGKTLDILFNELKSDYILLIDSDLEILNDKLIPSMKKYIRKSNVFGTGFTHGPCPCHINDWINGREGYYEERMWIPFTFLKTSLVKEALSNHCSFQVKTFYNILPALQKTSKWLLLKTPVLKKSNFSFFNIYKKDYSGEKHLFSAFDTGAEVFQYLRYNRFYYYYGFDVNSGIDSEFVCHYSGVTRKLLDSEDMNSTISADAIFEKIKGRLNEKYNFDCEYFMQKI